MDRKRTTYVWAELPDDSKTGIAHSFFEKSNSKSLIQKAQQFKHIVAFRNTLKDLTKFGLNFKQFHESPTYAQLKKGVTYYDVLHIVCARISQRANQLTDTNAFNAAPIRCMAT